MIEMIKVIQEQIKTYLRQHPYSTTRQMMQALDVSRETILHYLHKLDKQGQLRQQSHPTSSQPYYTYVYYLKSPLGS